MTRTGRARAELRALNTEARVPVPSVNKSTSSVSPWAPRWVVAALPILFAGLLLAAIRGDEPTTVIVQSGVVTPVSDLAPEVFVRDNTYAVIDPTAGDQLDVCTWDYCIVHDRIGAARIEQFTYMISLDEARAIARSVTQGLELPSVTLATQDLAGDLAGFYDPETASITLDEPIIAWTVIHELAHHVLATQHGPDAMSHGDLFLRTLDALAGE